MSQLAIERAPPFTYGVPEYRNIRGNQVSVAGTLLRQARLAEGISCRGLARRAETVPSRISEIERAVHDPGVSTLDHSLGALGWQLTAVPTRYPTAAAVALVIRDSAVPGIAASETDSAFRALLSLADGLSASDASTRVVLCFATPPLTGDERVDAAIAAIVEHFLEVHGLFPEWLNANERVLDEPWIPDPYASTNIADQTPPAFRRRGVFLAQRELGSV